MRLLSERNESSLSLPSSLENKVQRIHLGNDKTIVGECSLYTALTFSTIHTGKDDGTVPVDRDTTYTASGHSSTEDSRYLLRIFIYMPSDRPRHYISFNLSGIKSAS